MTDLADEIIMKRVREGDIGEMAVLFERYHQRICNYFFRLTYNMDVSQDLTQNLFYRMIKYRNSYNDQYSVKSWMFRIARNLHADFCRDEKHAGNIIIKTDSGKYDTADEAGSYDEDDYQRLEHAMATLTPGQREMIILSRYQGLKYEEISEIMNQSVSSIKVAIHRAIKQLRGVYFQQL